jgi:hypothetical protein
MLVAVGVVLAMGDAAISWSSSAQSPQQARQPRLVIFESFLHGG